MPIPSGPAAAPAPTIAPSRPQQGEEPRRRGRPIKYRDLSQQLAGARMRKQQQRERERAAGLRTIEFRLPDDLLRSLAFTAAFTFTDPKSLAAHLVTAGLPAFRQQIEQLSERAGLLWLKTAPAYRVAGMTAAQSAAATKELETVRQTLAAYGWTRERADRFIRRSGERAFLSRRAGSAKSAPSGTATHAPKARKTRATAA